MCGMVMFAKVCQVFAPSTCAASMTSPGRDCSPASRIRVMNGVHCQISSPMIARRGKSVIQSGCGAFAPKTWVSRPLKRPYSGLYIACFHSRAAATGTTRNGAIIIVRTAPRPMKFRLSSSAIPSPKASETSTTVTVSRMVKRTLWRRPGVGEDGREVAAACRT